MIEINDTNKTSEKVDTSTDKQQVEEVAGHPLSDIVADKEVQALKPNMLVGAKPCDRTEEQRNAIRQARRTFWIDRDGVVSFDLKQRDELADSLRHNR